MDLTRLGGKRTRRTRTWASVCVGLFGDGTPADPTGAGCDYDREDESRVDDSR